MSGPLVLALQLAIPVVSLVGLLVVVLVARTASRTTAPLQPMPDGTISVQGHVFRPDQQLSAQLDAGTYGTVQVTAHELVWASNAGAMWRTPITAVAVTAVHGSFSFSHAAVDIEVAGAGPWRLVVSDRPINRVMGNDAKRWRQAAVARSVADALLSRGARNATAPG